MTTRVPQNYKTAPMIKNDYDYDTFENLVSTYHKHPTGRMENIGQTYMRVLSAIRPDVASQIRGCLHDPSKMSEIPQQVRDRVRTLWYTD